jgi:hypothetical protein
MFQSDNIWIEARQRQTKESFDRGYVTRAIGDNFGNGRSSFFPLYLYATPKAQVRLVRADPRAIGWAQAQSERGSKTVS